MKNRFDRCSNLLAACLFALGLKVGSAAAAAPDIVQFKAPAGRAAASAAPCREGFEDIPHLYDAGKWLRFNRSGGRDTPVGSPSIFWDGLGTDALPAGWENVAIGAQTGTPLSRVMSAGFTLGAYDDTVSSWLLTPPLDFAPGATLSFWTRAVVNNIGGWPERLYVRLCSGDDCSDVGATPDEVGAFGQTLLAINPDLEPTDLCLEQDPTTCAFYPLNWRRYTVALPASGRGRVAFHNHYPNNSTAWTGYGLAVAIDTVELEGAPSCPFLADAMFGDGFEPPLDPGALTQNLDNRNVEPSMSVVCQYAASGFYTRNAWLRRFDLHGGNGLNGRVSISGVDVGIDAASGSQYVPVRLYSIAHGAELSYANLTLVGQAELPVDSTDSALIRNVPVTGVIADAAEQDLVVEVSDEYGEAYRAFFVGMNHQGQTAPTYYSGACGIPGDQGIFTPVMDGIVDLAQLVSAADGSRFYGPNDAMVLTVHVAERPTGAPGDVSAERVIR